MLEKMWIYSKRCGYNEEDMDMLKKTWIYLLPKPLSLSELLLSTIELIDHQAYWLSSLSPIKPINHRAHQPMSLLTIKPINHRAYWQSSLLIIEPINLWSSFVTFKPFGLFYLLMPPHWNLCEQRQDYWQDKENWKENPHN